MAVSDARNEKIKLAAGAVAGVIALVGIRKVDKILSVVAFGLTEGAPNTFSGIADLTAEFSIPADDQITNAGGTSTAGKLVIVHYVKGDARRGQSGINRSTGV
jgi:hypothetical protein